MHLAVEDPDLAQLRDLHRALCNQEKQLAQDALDFCLQNLLERLQQGRSLGLQLSIPAWATAESDTFIEEAAEEGPLEEAQS